MKLGALINRLVELAITNSLITSRDAVYARNRILALFMENSIDSTEELNLNLYETLDALTEIAVAKHLIEDLLSQKDIFASTIMNVFVPAPSYVEKDFWSRYEKAPQEATSYFYNLSQHTNYIKMNRIEKNVVFKSDSPYGDLDITINLSKPEKDPKEIARLKNAPTSNYPACLLCKENEGYAGTLTHPDRANHRMISLSVHNKDWFLQYSPYLYYNEHCILLSQTHEPMALTKDSFYNLLGFVKQFPHYFIGSNADLPIVGGSILAHEHYQGGCYEFPINRAKVLHTFRVDAFPGVTCELLNWPLSTLKLRCDNLNELAECTEMIYEKWKDYSDEAVDIISHAGTTRHNTVTPIAKKIGDEYVMYVVLRNNRTTEEHPLGLFHPHEDVHHIKKENIGLIEVMGLAILPGRLLQELEEVKAYILGNEASVPDYHLSWANTLKASYNPHTDLEFFIQKAIGDKFSRVLEDAGVFKLTEEGIRHFKKFVCALSN